jgi:hypothetical protein
METSHPQFEAVKVGIKQDNSGYILTLRIHPDDLDERIMRDFVGARYMTVMVRLNEEEKPMNREQSWPRTWCVYLECCAEIPSSGSSSRSPGRSLRNQTRKRQNG